MADPLASPSGSGTARYTNVGGLSLDNITGQYIDPASGQPVTDPGRIAAAQAASRASTSSSSSVSSSTSSNITPQVVQRDDGSTWLFDPSSNSFTQLAPAGGMTAYQAAQLQNQYDIANQSENGQNGRSAAQIAATSADQASAQQATAADQAANRQSTLLGQQMQDAFTASNDANTAANNNAFTASQSALTRAQQAGEFAATYSIQAAQQQQAQQAAQLAAAKTYSDLSGSADLTGFKRFQDAGGGVLGNSLAAGATSVTPLGQLGAARALEAATAPPPQLAQAPGGDVAGATPAGPYDPAGSYAAAAQAGQSALALDRAQMSGLAGSANPFAPGANGAIANAQQSGGGAAAPTSAAQKPIVIPGLQSAGNAPVGWTPGVGYTANSGTPLVGSGPGATPSFAFGSAEPPIDRYAMGTSYGRTNYGHERYATGTLGRQQLGAVGPLAIDPNGGSSPVMPGYAKGTFITGDSTDPNDPAAGGAHPEQISLTKNSADQPEASVTPMVPPGVGDTEDSDDGGSIGALLIAIGKFLTTQQGGQTPASAVPPGRFALGAIGRFDLGTAPLDSSAASSGNGGLDTSMFNPAITAADQPYVDNVLQTRASTPVSVNPYAANYQQTSPTQRAIDAAAFQTQTGVPGSELDFENQLYQPKGLARGSSYSRELDLGI